MSECLFVCAWHCVTHSVRLLSDAGSRKKLAIHTYTIHSSCSYSGSLRSKLVFSNEFFSLSHQSCRHRHHNLFFQRCCCRHLYYRHLAHIQSHESKATLFFKCFEAHDLSPVKPSAMIKEFIQSIEMGFLGSESFKSLWQIFCSGYFSFFPQRQHRTFQNSKSLWLRSRITWKYVNTLSLNSLCKLLLGVFPQRSAHQIETDNNESNWDWIVDWFDSNAQCQVNNCIAFALPLPFCVGVAVVVDMWISFYIYFGLICRLWRCSLKNPVSIKCRWLGGEIPNFLLQLNIERKIFNFRRSTNKHRHTYKLWFLSFFPPIKYGDNVRMTRRCANEWQKQTNWKCEVAVMFFGFCFVQINLLTPPMTA